MGERTKMCKHQMFRNDYQQPSHEKPAKHNSQQSRKCSVTWKRLDIVRGEVVAVLPTTDFPWHVRNLWLTCDQSVGKTDQLTIIQLSLPSLLGRKTSTSSCIDTDYGGIETIKTADHMAMMYGYRPQSVRAGLGCGLGCMPAPSVTHSPIEAAYAAIESQY